MKKIFIPTILDSGAPVEWNYDETTGQAVCLFTLHQSSRKPNIKALSEKLKKIPHIEVNAKSARITDMRHFNYVPVLDLHQPSVKFAEPTPRARSNSSPPASPTSDSPASKPSPISCDSFSAIHAGVCSSSSSSSSKNTAVPPLAIPLPGLTRRNPGISPRLFTTPSIIRSASDTPLGRPLLSPRAARSIAIDDLGMSAETFRNTFVYEKSLKDNFEHKIQQDQQTRIMPETILAQTSLFRKLQYETSSIITSIKQKMTHELRHLFDGLLNPAFRSGLNPDETVTPALRMYFEAAMLSVMNPKPLKEMPEEYLRMMVSTIIPNDSVTVPDFAPELYSVDIFAHAREQYKLAAINTDLWRFYFFISDLFPAGRLTQDETSNAILERFKQRVQPIKSEIRASLTVLSHLTLELIQKSAERKLVESRLNGHIESHHPVVNGYMSFYCLMMEILKSVSTVPGSKSSLSDQAMKDMANEITLHAIKVIPEKCQALKNKKQDDLVDKQVDSQVDTLRGGQTDFYISAALFQYWDTKLRAELETKYSPASLKKALNTKEDKYSLVQSIGKELTKSLENYLDVLKICTQPSSSSSNSSCSSSSSDAGLSDSAMTSHSPSF